MVRPQRKDGDMTAYPGTAASAPVPLTSPRRLRFFYLAMAVLNLLAALLFGVVRFVLSERVADAPRLLVGQEALCVVSLACLAALQFWLSGTVAHRRVDRAAALRRVRVARPVVLCLGGLCMAGLVAVLVGAGDVLDKIPTILFTTFVLMAFAYTAIGSGQLSAHTAGDPSTSSR
jgi:hypothetical protein